LQLVNCSYACVHAVAGNTNGLHDAHMNGNGVTKHNGIHGDVAVDVNGQGEVQPDDDRGMVLPFSPITISFRDIRYFVPLPAVCCLRTSDCVSLYKLTWICVGMLSQCVSTRPE